MLQHLKDILQPSGDTQFIRLTKEYYTLDFSDFKTASEFLTHVKLLEERIDATKVTLTPDKRTLLCLIMALSDQDEYRPMVQLWALTPNLTAKQAEEMLLEEERRETHAETIVNAKAARFGK